MAFENDVVGGITLVRPAIRSANYLPGVSGWSINRDGSAEFASGTFRGPVIVQSPTTGAVLASIGANGNISGQIGNFTDVIANGISLDSALIAGARGIIGYWDIGATALPAPGNGVFTNLAWVRCNWDTSRVVRVTTRLLPVQTTSTTYQILTSQWVYANSQSTGFSFGSQVQSVPSASFGGTQFPDMFQNIAYFADSTSAANGGRATFTLQVKSTDAVTNFVNGGWGLVVEDIGPLSAVTTFRDGGTGTPSGSTTYTKTYVCTASRSYDSSGNPIATPDGNNNVYQGSFPDRSYGDEQSILIFPGATIRSDLTGATINSATLTMYCIKSENTTGTLQYDTGTQTTPPATLTGAGPGGTFTYGAAWPVPGWHTVSMLDNVSGNTALGNIQAGANAVILDTTLFGSNATGFAGFGAGSSTRPYITINYTK
jgi:hypothetical protein